MKGLQAGIPLAVLAAIARAQMFEVGGNHGDDNGNRAGLSFDQTHNTGINNAASNEQKVSYNELVKGKFGHFRRDHADEDHVGANHGDNSIGNSHKEGTKTQVGNNGNNDQDDSVNDLFQLDDILHKRQTDVSGNHGDDLGNVAGLGGSQTVNTDIKNSWENDEDVNVNIVHEDGKHPKHEHHCHKCEKHDDHDKREINMLSPTRKRSGPGSTDVGGNDGDDLGNKASLGGSQAVNTDIKNSWENDEDVNVNIVHEDGKHPKHEHHCHKCEKHDDHDKREINTLSPTRKRSGPGSTDVGGNRGDDIGNVASLGGSQAVNTDIKNSWENDKDVNVNVVHPKPEHHCHECEEHGGHDKREINMLSPIRKRSGPGSTDVGGNDGDDIGNVASLGGSQAVNTDIKNSWENDKDVNVNVVHPKPEHHCHECEKHGGHAKRFGPGSTDVGGNQGDDLGNKASLGGAQAVNTDIKNNWENKEDVKVNIVHEDGKHPKPEHHCHECEKHGGHDKREIKASTAVSSAVVASNSHAGLVSLICGVVALLAFVY